MTFDEQKEFYALSLALNLAAKQYAHSLMNEKQHYEYALRVAAIQFGEFCVSHNLYGPRPDTL